MSAWHAKRTEEVLKELGTGRRSGLSEPENGWDGMAATSWSTKSRMGCSDVFWPRCGTR